MRNNWIEAGFAMLNGAPTFLTLVERHRAAARGAHRAAARAGRASATPLMPVAGQPQHVSRRGLRHAGRQPDHHRQSGACASSRWPASVTTSCSKAITSLFDADRAAADVQKIVEAGGEVMGRYDYPHYYFLNMVTEAGGGLEHKNSFLGDDRPLHDADAPRVSRLARPRRARVLPQLEHQAAAADRARAVRLRERGPHQGAVDCRRLHRLLRAGCSSSARRSRRATSISKSCPAQIEARADDAGPPGHAGRHGVVRHVDQAVSPRREHAEHDGQLLPEGRRHRVSARREDPPGDQRRASRWTTRCGWRTRATRAPRATRSISSTRR